MRASCCFWVFFVLPICSLTPDTKQAENLLAQADALLESHQPLRAVPLYKNALKINPRFGAAYNNLANAYRQLNQPEKAVRIYSKAIDLFAQDSELSVGTENFPVALHYNLANVQLEMQNYQAAAANFERVIALSPKFVSGYLHLAHTYKLHGDGAKVVETYQAAIRANPTDAVPHYNFANTLADAGATRDALQHYEAAVKLQPDYSEAYTNLGTFYLDAGRADDAEHCFRVATKFQPTLAEAYTNLGTILHNKGDLKGAIAAGEHTVALRPSLAAGHYNLARAYEVSEQWQQSMSHYETALELQPDYPEAFCSLYHVRHHLAFWKYRKRDFKALLKLVDAANATGKPSCVQPFRAFPYRLSPARFLSVVRLVSLEAKEKAMRFPSILTGSPPNELSSEGRVRIGYISSDFGAHTVGSLVRSLFGKHNRKYFEVFCFALSGDDGSPWRREIQRDADHFVDVTALTDEAAAFAVSSSQVHVLVDLNGHSKGARLELLARLSVPITIGWLGFPASAGGITGFILGDAVTTPPEYREYYSEHMVLVPHTYFANDHRRLYGPTVSHRPRDWAGELGQPANVGGSDGGAGSVPLRREYGLPEEGFIFCNFGQNYKVEPRLLDIWIAAVKAVPGSVLWLLAFPSEASDNLRREALRRGLRNDSLNITPLLPLDNHVNIKSLCDLSLDTLAFNAHTTGADSLFAGVPVITHPAEIMPGRVGASLAHGLHLSETVTRTLDDYQNMMVHLGNNPTAIERLRRKLEKHIWQAPLFDNARWLQNFERTVRMMWDVHASTGSRFHIVTAGDDDASA